MITYVQKNFNDSTITIQTSLNDQENIKNVFKQEE